MKLLRVVCIIFYLSISSTCELQASGRRAAASPKYLAEFQESVHAAATALAFLPNNVKDIIAACDKDERIMLQVQRRTLRKLYCDFLLLLDAYGNPEFRERDVIRAADAQADVLKRRVDRFLARLEVRTDFKRAIPTAVGIGDIHEFMLNQKIPPALRKTKVLR
jgi:hypothetical protein